MFSIGLLVLVIAVVYAVSRLGGGSHAAPHAAPEADRLASWVTAGLMTEEQAEAIRSHEAALAPAPSPARADRARAWRMPAVAEPLGYLGAVLAVVGLLLVVSRFWPDMGTAARLALSGAAAAVLVAGGALVAEAAEPALARLRWALWLAGTAAAGLFSGIAVGDGFGAHDPETVTLAAAGAVAVLSGLLWRGRERPVQQATALAGAVIALGALGAHLDATIGAGALVASSGAVVLLVGIRRLTSAPPLAAVIGSVSVAVGAQMLSIERPSLQLVGVAAALTMLALPSIPQLDPRLEHRISGVAGILLLLTVLPSTLGHFAADAGLATGAVTWLAGAALLVIGVRGLVLRAPVVEVVGGLAMLGGAALVGVQYSAVAPLVGIATGAGLLALGARSEQLRHSVLGALGLLVHVPWAIGRFFPGEGRVPLLLLVTGVLVLGLAVLLARHGDRTPRPPLGGGPLTPHLP